MKLIILVSIACAAWLSLSRPALADEAGIERALKLKFCKAPDLTAAAFFSSDALEKNCIYSLAAQGYMVIVTQSVAGGIIVEAQNGPTNGKAIFIKTKTKYADGDIVHDQFVKSDGLKKLTTVAGAVRTLNAFKWLGDAVPAGE